MKGESPEALVVAEVLRRIRDAVGRLGMRADGALNHADLYRVLDEEYERAAKKSSNG
jgi:hypothetical protein